MSYLDTQRAEVAALDEYRSRVQIKNALIAVLIVDATMHNRDIFSEGFVGDLRQAGWDFWSLAAEKGGLPMPSAEVVAGVISFFAAVTKRNGESIR